MPKIPIPPENLPPALDVPVVSPKLVYSAETKVTYPIEKYRSTGVVKNTKEDDPNGAYLQFHKLYSRLRVQWDRDEVHNVTSTLNNRANMLEWEPKALKVVENVTGLRTSIPRKCPGRVTKSKLKSSDNADSQTCPCSFLYGNDPDVWKGHLCPGESVKAYQHFVRYVRELGIRETDHVDIGMVIDLIQLHIMEDRCTENLQIHGLFEDKAAVVAQKTGQVIYDRQPSSVIKVRADAQAARAKLLNSLMATREKRETLRAQQVKEKHDDEKVTTFTNLAELFSEIHSLGEKAALNTTFVSEDINDVIEVSYDEENEQLF